MCCIFRWVVMYYVTCTCEFGPPPPPRSLINLNFPLSWIAFLQRRGNKTGNLIILGGPGGNLDGTFGPPNDSSKYFPVQCLCFDRLYKNLWPNLNIFHTIVKIINGWLHSYVNRACKFIMRGMMRLSLTRLRFVRPGFEMAV